MWFFVKVSRQQNLLTEWLNINTCRDFLNVEAPDRVIEPRFSLMSVCNDKYNQVRRFRAFQIMTDSPAVRAIR